MNLRKNSERFLKYFEVMFTKELTQGRLDTFADPGSRVHRCSFLNFQRPAKSNRRIGKCLLIF